MLEVEDSEITFKDEIFYDDMEDVGPNIRKVFVVVTTLLLQRLFLGGSKKLFKLF